MGLLSGFCFGVLGGLFAELLGWYQLRKQAPSEFLKSMFYLVGHCVHGDGWWRSCSRLPRFGYAVETDPRGECRSVSPPPDWKIRRSGARCFRRQSELISFRTGSLMIPSSDYSRASRALITFPINKDPAHVDLDVDILFAPGIPERNCFFQAGGVLVQTAEIALDVTQPRMRLKGS
jgi:hypothetical protein